MRKQIKNLLMGIVVGAMLIPTHILYAQETKYKIKVQDLDNKEEIIRGFEYEIKHEDGTTEPLIEKDDYKQIELPKGKYTLVETKRPKGYLKLKDTPLDLPMVINGETQDIIEIYPKHEKEKPTPPEPEEPPKPDTPPTPETPPTPNEPPIPPYHEGEIKIITHDPDPDPKPKEEESKPTPEPTPEPKKDEEPHPEPTPEPNKEETPEPIPQPTPKQEKFTKTGFAESKTFNIIQTLLLGGILVVLIKNRTDKKQ